MYDRNGIRLSIIHTLPAIADANGVSLRHVLLEGGLEEDAFLNADQVIRRSQVHAVMQALARRSGDATIGFKMANATRPDRLGLSGTSPLAGRTLREALTLQRRYMPSLQRGISISITTHGPRVQWTHRMHASDPGEARFLNEGIAAFQVKFVRAVSGDGDARLHVVLPHRPIIPLSKYEEALRCAVSFVPGHDLAIRFDAGLLDRRNSLRSADGPDLGPTDFAAVPVECDLTDEQLLQSLVRMFEVSALMGRLSLREAALRLGFSSRSLQRRLAELDTSFEEVVDQWRHRQAAAFLSGPDAGTAMVATRLGYTDASHFIRAFRRWRGLSPMEFRRERA